MSRVDATAPRAALWFALLAGPLAWTGHELLSYMLVKVACSTGLGVLEHLVTLGALAVAAAGAHVGMRIRAGSPPDPPEFVANVAVTISGLFVFAILMEAIPDIVLNPCL